MRLSCCLQVCRGQSGSWCMSSLPFAWKECVCWHGDSLAAGLQIGKGEGTHRSSGTPRPPSQRTMVCKKMSYGSYMLDLLPTPSDLCLPIAPWMPIRYQTCICPKDSPVLPQCSRCHKWLQSSHWNPGATLVPLASQTSSLSLTRNVVNFISRLYSKSLPFHPLL